MSVPPDGSQPGQGQPGYGTVPYSQPGYAVAPTTNGLAIASLVCSLVGALTSWFIPFVVSVVGVVLGHIALNQIKSNGQGGRGLAIAGLVIGYISVGLVLLAVIAVLVLGLGFAFWGLTSA